MADQTQSQLAPKRIGYVAYLGWKITYANFDPSTSLSCSSSLCASEPMTSLSNILANATFLAHLGKELLPFLRLYPNDYAEKSPFGAEDEHKLTPMFKCLTTF